MLYTIHIEVVDGALRALVLIYDGERRACNIILRTEVRSNTAYKRCLARSHRGIERNNRTAVESLNNSFGDLIELV